VGSPALLREKHSASRHTDRVIGNSMVIDAIVCNGEIALTKTSMFALGGTP
jgi:hypothetical protein